MAFDDHGLARRALVQNDLKPKHIASRISLSNPWDYFTFTGRDDLPADDRLLNLSARSTQTRKASLSVGIGTLPTRPSFSS